MKTLVTFFQNAPIRRKQVLIIMLTTSVALFLACAAFTACEIANFRKELSKNVASLADVIGGNSAASLDFNDATSAEETLGVLRIDSNIAAACIYDRSGRVFARYEQADGAGSFSFPALPAAGNVFTNDQLWVTRPIVLKGEQSGTIFVVSNLAELSTRLAHYLEITGLVFAVALLAALALSSRLQRLISEPILELVQTTRTVAREKDYSIRMARHSSDEIGSLMDEFNEMLAQIQERDARLEQRVEERTRELAHERDLLRALMENSPDQIYFKDTQSRFLRCSHSMAEKFGAGGAGELLGKSDADFFTDDHAHTALADEQVILRTGQPMIGKVEREISKAGRETWALTSKMPFRSLHGEVIGTFGISKDITEMKEAEASLAQVHKQLLDTSRQAGMAEVATSVLHNVGNVLNSVNVSSSLIADKTRNSKVTNLAKAVTLMHAHNGSLADFFSNDPKGKQLPGYLASLAGHLAQEQQDILREVGSLVNNVVHIKEIVSMQQNYAKSSGLQESLLVTDLVEDAIRMNNGAMDRHQVKVVREFAVLPPFLTEKHKVLQILVNLIRNAKYACDDSGREDKQIILRVAGAGGRIQVSVIDNGIGIPPENLTRIFNHGFTTRKEGHGFGLHSGALAARELGGTLTAFSEGIGHGATFTLELPVKKTSL